MSCQQRMTKEYKIAFIDIEEKTKKYIYKRNFKNKSKASFVSA